MNPFRRVLSWYFSKASLPYWCILLLDCTIIFLSGIFTYWLFRKTMVFIDHRYSVINTMLFYVCLSIIGARIFCTYSGIVRFSSFIDLLKVAYANGITLALALVTSIIFEAQGFEPLSALTQTEVVVTFLLATLLMWSLRVVVKALHDVSYSSNRAMGVLIYGALSGGIGLAKSIRSQQPRRFVLKGFISHDKRAKHIQLMGKKVYNIEDDLAAIIKKEGVEAILVSPLRVEEFRNNQAIQDVLIGAGCKIFMTPQTKEANIKDGQLSEEEIERMPLKEVTVEDLLPRSEIHMDMKSVGDMLNGQKVLITGSAGSIGTEIVRQVAKFNPAELILIDQAETPQHDIRLMMAKDYPTLKVHTIVTSICNKDTMDNIFNKYRPDYVFHAAAYKHVPMMEDNPCEAVSNNIFGTKVIADLAVKYQTKKFVMISTDKAVNPTNVMGCSKRICEIYVQSLGRQTSTQFVTTRFGNVLGSNGSVIPLFKEQIKNGGPVTVTHPDITRYFMLIPEACELVLEAGTMGHGGEIFVFDMGQPVRIAELADRMIKMSKAKDVQIVFTGLRPGEKLYEEVLNVEENTKPTFHEKIRIAEVREYDYNVLSHEVDELIAIAKEHNDMATVRKMKEIVPEYKSNNSVYEKLD